MTNKNEVKEIIEKKESKIEKEKLKNIYLIEYYIKDLSNNKIIETNLEKHKKDNENIIFLNAKKPIFESMGNIFPKVEEFIYSAKDNEEKTFKLDAKDAYGLREKDLLKIVPLSNFKENKINPFVGLAIQSEDMYGVVKSISGGRVLVDFNSPYADKNVEVYVKKLNALNDLEKIKQVLDTFFKKINATLKSFDNGIIEIKLETENQEVYKQLIEGFLKQFVDFKELKL
jgi:peptidylprolyl isomerase